MKKSFIAIFIFLCGTLYANDYRWDYINALTESNIATIENILSERANSMQPAERRLFVNFIFHYTTGETVETVLRIFERYNIYPNAYDLFTALTRNQPDMVIQSILSRGVQPNGEILLLAAERQRFDLAIQFIQSGADVNFNYPSSSSYADGMTPLLYAAKWDNFDLVKKLVEHGARINARDKNGNSALSYANNNENIQISNFLIENGASDTGFFNEPPAQAAQSTGISQVLNNSGSFQPGVYRLHGGNIDLRFTGTASNGSISHLGNNITRNGTYRIDGNSLHLVMEGRTFTYRIDSGMTFSGNSEVWVRTGN